MKQMLKRTQNLEYSPRRRSTSRSREFRQVITVLTNGYPKGHFLAYCLVSKESSFGIFLNERLLALDTLTKQLKYYSHIPQLPLTHPQQLPAPKEGIKLKAGVEFHLEKIRIGHVIIRWEENRQKLFWKIIMGSNQICRQFYDLFMKVMQAQGTVASEETKIPQEYRLSKNLPVFIAEMDSPKKQASSNLEDLSMKNHPRLSQSLLEPLPRQKSNSLFSNFNKGSSEFKLNISLQENQSFNDTDRFFSNKYKVLEIQRALDEENSPQKANIMTIDWITAKSQQDKSAIYSKFVQKCIRKVENIMENFMASHLMHEEYLGLHLIRDTEIEIYYVPLVVSTEEDESSMNLIHQIEQEEAMLDEWECLNYLSLFKTIKSTNILVPMTCLLTFRSFKFFCKSSLELYPYKQRIFPSQYNQEIVALQKLTHLHLRNGKQQIYTIEHKTQLLLYFNRISCVPKVSSLLPVSIRYIELYITQGVISNQKDIEAISSHISNKLLRKLQENMSQKSFSSSCELMDYLYESGLTYHYLPSLFDQKHQTFSYIQRLIASQIIACAMQWEIRRRMQIQLFKKREFGFAVNQLRIAINLLFLQEKYFIKILEKIIKSLFNFTFSNLIPLKNIIEHEIMLISLLNRLAINCSGPFLNFQQLDWIWSEKYVNDYIQFTPFIDSKLLRFEIFSNDHLIFKTGLIGQVNNELNMETQLQKVISALRVQKDSNGLYSISHTYAILPSELKMKTNYYLSHFISSSTISQNSLETQIYLDHSFTHYYTHTLQYLTTLNKIRWLARMKYYDQAEELLDREIEKAIIWNQLHYLIQIYSFYAKLKLKQGQIHRNLEFSLKALQYSLLQYDKESSVFLQLLIAEHAFQAANFHYSAQYYSKSLDLYSTVEDILSKISTSGDKVNLNPQFLELYINKCSIYLLFGQYNECLEECLSGLKSSEKFKTNNKENNTNSYQFRIYEILFRCYQIKNMRNELIEVSNICCEKYFEDPTYAKKDVDLQILTEIIKMLWLNIIKQVELVSTSKSFAQPNAAKLKIIYLKKIKQQLKLLRYQLSDIHRYGKAEVQLYLARKILKHQQNPQECRLGIQIINCLADVTLNSRGLQSSRLYEKDAIDNQWLMLEGLAVFTGYDFLIGSIDDYLHLYDYQY